MKKILIFAVMLIPAVLAFCQVQTMPGQAVQQPSGDMQKAPKANPSPLSIYQSERQTYPYDVKRKTAKQRRLATREGVSNIKKKNYSTAVSNFRKALKADSNYAKAQYNLAVAHSKLNQNDSAISRYNQVCRNGSTTPELRVNAHYNAGNIHLRQALAARDSGSYDAENLKAAIEQYKAALRLDSHNSDAQHNLSLAKQLLRPEQQQQGQGGGQSQQNKDQQQNQNQQQQQQQNQDKKEQQQQDQQSQQGQQNEQQQQQGQHGQQDKRQQEQRRREAEQMLNAMKNNEQQTMKAIHARQSDKSNGKPAKIEKDW